MLGLLKKKGSFNKNIVIVFVIFPSRLQLPYLYCVNIYMFSFPVSIVFCEQI